MRAVLLPVGADWCALAMESVGEVVANPRPTTVPTSPATLLGLFNLRGAVLPLLDTAALLGLPPIGLGPFCAVVLTPLGAAGLVVTGQPEVAELHDPVSPPAGVACLAGYRVGDRLVSLLDADLLIAPECIGLTR